MKKPQFQSNLSFRLMAWKFRIRDRLRPPSQILREAGVRDGMTVLDFGCGPGGFAIAAAKLVGKQGRVYAFDIHPLALKYVQRAIANENIQNVMVIGSDAISQIPEESIDLVLAYDILHDLAEPVKILSMMHRMLKPQGVLSVSDHHLDETSILSKVTADGLFVLAERNQQLFQFNKADIQEAEK